MRYTRTLFTLAAGSMLAACQRDLPTAPANRELVVSAASFNGATQDWERRTIFNDHTFFIPCLNENARIYGYVSYQLHEVATPSGGYDFVIQYLPQTPKDPPFVLQGLISGKVFYYAFGRPVIVSFHSGAGETQTQIVNEKYVAADGSTILGDATFHYTVNANGELAVSRDVGYALTCV